MQYSRYGLTRDLYKCNTTNLVSYFMVILIMTSITIVLDDLAHCSVTSSMPVIIKVFSWRFYGVITHEVFMLPIIVTSMCLH